MVAVTDTGSGMTAEVASRAFEPFFTTKEVGKGTGLGLSMVYGFVRQSGGLVQMQSEPGHGSVVRLFFPRLATPPTEDPSPRERIASPDGSETILFVEDDDMVRAYVVNELKTLGYRVIEAPNGPAALDLLRQPGDIHLLFTDVVMPGGMFGPELARQAAQLRPGLKVLFTSGYTQNPVKAPDGLGDARILTKPFRRHDLAAMLRSALSAPPR
jgi:CheY-like chemotaxis protein